MPRSLSAAERLRRDVRRQRLPDGAGGGSDGYDEHRGSPPAPPAGHSAGHPGDDAIAADLKTPWGIKLLSGGQVTDDVSYYMYFFLTERGEIAGLEDAYLQFNDILGSGVDLIAGQFQVSDPLFKRELRLEYEDYMPYRVRVGEVTADLTYERGLMAMTSLWKDADLFVQVVNGRGLSEATETKDFDTDNTKNVAVRLSQDLGAIRLGGFYYGGNQRAGDVESTLLVLGPDATVPLGDKVEVNVQYMYRRDDNPFFLESCVQSDIRCSYGASDPLRTEVDAFMAEMMYSPQGAMGQWHFTGLYNRVEADRPVFSLRVGEPGPLQKYESVGVSAHYVKARNLRFMAEVSQDVTLSRTRFTTGVVTAF